MISRKFNLLVITITSKMNSVDVKMLDSPTRAKILYDIVCLDREIMMSDAKKVHSYCANLESLAMPFHGKQGIMTTTTTK